MADFDMPGIAKARMGLTELARSPARRGGCSKVKYELVRELYTEIRAARLAGHSWNSVRKAIVKNMNVEISTSSLAKFFREIDKLYEAETGVKALPETGAKRKRGRPRKYVSMPEAVKGE